MIYATAFCLSFVSVFLKGFSQQNVIHRRKGLIIPTSLLLASAEMFMAAVFVTNFITASLWSSVGMAITIGVGGGLGCIFSLDFHSWVTKKIYKWDKEIRHG